LDHKAASRPDLQEAFVRQAFQRQVQRDTRHLQLRRQRDLADSLSGAQAALNQQFPQSQRRPSGL